MLTLRQLHGLLVAAVVTSILLLLVPQTRLSLEVLQQASRPLAAGGDSLSLAASPQRVLRLQQEDEQAAVGGTTWALPPRPVVLLPGDLAPHLHDRPSEEICMIWFVQPDMDQYLWLLDHIFADDGEGRQAVLSGRHFRVLYDEGGASGLSCPSSRHTLVVDICNEKRLATLAEKAYHGGRLGVYCLADEDSGLRAEHFRGIHYAYHEYGGLEGAAHVMPVPLGPTGGFGLASRAMRHTPSGFRSQGCVFKGRPSSEQRRALYGHGQLGERCNLLNTKGFKRGDHPHAFRTELGATGVCPCPKGASLEQFRLWEALEVGCIPVVGSGLPMPSILGAHHPLPTLSDEQWSSGGLAELLGTIDRYGRPGPEADRKRAEINDWYRAYKSEVQHRASLLLLDTDSYRQRVLNSTAVVTTTEQATHVTDAVAVTCLVFNTRVDLPEFQWLADLATPSSSEGGPRHSLVIRWLSDQESSTTASPDGPLLASGCDTIMVVHEGDSGSKDRLRALWDAARGYKAARMGLALLRVGGDDEAAELLDLNKAARGLDLLLADADSIGAARRHHPDNSTLLLLPRGPRRGFGNHVGIPQARRPASTRALCSTPKQGQLRPDKERHADLLSACPLLDLKATKPSSDIYSPGHVRLRLLDVALLALPYGGEEHGQPQDWHVLWEGLACGAVPILSADSIIYKELAQVSGGREMLPIPAFPAADWAGPSSPVRAFVEGLREDPARLDGLQRSVYSWSLGMKRWLALRVKSAMTGHGTEW